LIPFVDLSLAAALRPEMQAVRIDPALMLRAEWKAVFRQTLLARTCRPSSG
jgi:hypothetical protein